MEQERELQCIEVARRNEQQEKQAEERRMMLELHNTVQQNILEKRRKDELYMMRDEIKRISERLMPGYEMQEDGSFKKKPKTLVDLKRSRRNWMLNGLAISAAFLTLGETVLQTVSVTYQIMSEIWFVPVGIFIFWQVLKGNILISSKRIEEKEMPQKVLPGPPVTPRPSTGLRGGPPKAIPVSGYQFYLARYLQRGKDADLQQMLSHVYEEFPQEEADYTL